MLHGPGAERLEIGTAPDLLHQRLRQAVARAVREHEMAALEALQDRADVLDGTELPHVLEPDGAAANGCEAGEDALSPLVSRERRGGIERTGRLGERPPLVPRAGRRFPDPPRMPAERVAERLGLDALVRRQRTADLLLDDREPELERQARELDRLAVPDGPRRRRDDERAARRREDGLRFLPLEPKVVDDERPPVFQRPSQAAARRPHGRVTAVVELLEERLQGVVERSIQRVDVRDPVRERASGRVVRDVREDVRLADARLAVDVDDPALLRGGDDGAGLALAIDVIR